MKLGIERLLEDRKVVSYLQTKRVALLAHPASVISDLTHSVDALLQAGVKLSSAFGPQHGMKGDKQDNMVESDDYIDPHYKIPVFSLYGKVRKPTPQMCDTFDVILIDLQDLGCRIYTFITTMLYVLEEAARLKKQVWILDRPNPAGRPVEGYTLMKGWESFVGAGPLPMRYGLTMGELARWFISHFKLNVECKVISMEGYNPESSPGYGWPIGERCWVNPSPNAATLNMARCYAGTVVIEGTTLSEGRGTTRALEIVGAPDIDFTKVLEWMKKASPPWLEGCVLRLCHFEPTFQKHTHKLCNGIQIHADHLSYSHDLFKPFRVVALMLKAIRQIYPQYEIWRNFPYEYDERLAIDVINGSPSLREWVDNSKLGTSEMEKALIADERAWIEERRKFLIY